MKSAKNTRKMPAATPAQIGTWWQTAGEQPGQGPMAKTEKQGEAAARLSPEVKALLEELAPYDVKYHPEEPCKRCGCPLTYSLKLDSGCRVCCRCLPGGYKYGYERHERILALFPKGGAGP